MALVRGYAVLASQAASRGFCEAAGPARGTRSAQRRFLNRRQAKCVTKSSGDGGNGVHRSPGRARFELAGEAKLAGPLRVLDHALEQIVPSAKLIDGGIAHR